MKRLTLTAALVVMGCAEAPAATPLRQVIDGAGIDIDVAFSSDRQSYVYASSRGGPLELWVLPVAGAPPSRLTTSVQNSADRYPAMTPDGKSVVFQSNRGGVKNVWMVDIATRAMSQLTTFVDGAASRPALGRDGRTICFTRTTESGGAAIWTMGIDGQDARELVAGVDCTWTPDGRIVFSRQSETGGSTRYDIWVVDADGMNARELAETSQPWVRYPTVSPDGSRLVYTAYADQPSADIQEGPGGVQINPRIRADLWIASLADPGRPHELLVGGTFNSYAAWAPDGRSLLFTSTRSGSADVWLADVTR